MTSMTELFAVTIARAADLQGPLPYVGPRHGADDGDPQISKIEFFANDEIRFGVWESTPGGWEIENRTENESILLLAGRVRIAPRGQEPVEFVAGDAFVLSKGWTGRWETVETARKLYTTTR